MPYEPETPFDSIESALEYVSCFLETTQETQCQVKTEIALAVDPRLARRKEALLIVQHKLGKLSSHLSASRLILNDLRKLRRLLLKEPKLTEKSAVASAS